MAALVSVSMATLRLEPSKGWSAFGAWAIAGSLWSVTLISFVGLFTLPFALLLTGLLVRYSPQRRDALGLLAGAAGVALVLGVVNLGYQPCPESGTLTMLSGEGSSSCGGVAPAPFFVVGVVLMILGLGPYLFTHATEPA